MKTLHLSIIIGAGIAVFVGIGIFIIVFPNSVAIAEYNPTCNPAPNSSNENIVLQQITWLSVIEIEKNQTKLDCTTVNSETFSTLPKIEHALSGADQCMQGKDGVCSFPSGIGLMMVPPSDKIIPMEDNMDYRVSLTQDETNSLLNNVKLVLVGNLTVGDVKYNDKYYQIILWTGNKFNSPQVKAYFTPKIGFVPYDLEKGESVNYTITVQTLATFGVPAKVQLDPINRVHDSGLDVKIVPDVLTIPERSNANATMTITAGPNAQNGTYYIGFLGKIPNGGFAGGINLDPCPCIRIGHSDWALSTAETPGYGGWGGKDPPKWLQVKTTTDKQVYHIGETVKIESFITNDSPNKITLDNGMRIFVNIYNQVNGTGAYRYFYETDAIYDGQQIILEPHSTIMIDRPFYWDQSDLRTESVTHKVIPGDYRVDVSFGSYAGSVWDNDMPITIK